MTSKERVLRNYHFQPVDRFTIDFCAESKIYALLREHYGVPDDLALMERLHVDFRYPKPNWIGPPLIDDQGRPTDYFGIPRTGAGDFGYPIFHPLAEVQTVAEVEAYAKWPSADMWDYDRYAEDCRRFDEYAVYGGAWAWFFEAACELMGMDRFFLLIADKPEVAHAILERVTRFMERTSEIMFEKAGRYIDICFTGDDYGFQTGPMMSMKMFREFVQPYLQRIYNVGRRNGKLMMHHSCGSVARWIPLFLEMGLNILEPIQVGAAHESARTRRSVRRQTVFPRLYRHAVYAAVRHARGRAARGSQSCGDLPAVRWFHNRPVTALDDRYSCRQHRCDVRCRVGICMVGGRRRLGFSPLSPRSLAMPCSGRISRRSFLAMTTLAASARAQNSRTVFVVPNFHPASCGWLTNFSKERVYCANSYFDHLDRVRDDPNYCFALSECNNMIAMMNFKPERTAELQSAIRAGRVELVNAFFLESTVNLSGGEALVRLGIEGLRWQQAVFGARPRFAWCIDVCGTHPQMAQIAAGLGLEAWSTRVATPRIGDSLGWTRRMVAHPRYRAGPLLGSRQHLFRYGTHDRGADRRLKKQLR